MTIPNSPRHIAFEMSADDLFATVSDTLEGEVTTEEQDAALSAVMDDLRQLKKDAEAARKEDKQPHLDAGRAVDEAYRVSLTKCDMAIEAIKKAVTPYRAARQAEKDEAARMAREEAEALLRAAQAKRAEPEHLTAAYDAEQELTAAKKLAAQANKIERGPTGLRTRQVAVIEDRKALLQHVMKNDPATLTEWLQAYAQRALPSQLPGVRIEVERKAA